VIRGDARSPASITVPSYAAVAIEANAAAVPFVDRVEETNVALKATMAEEWQAEHLTAELAPVQERRTDHILDNERASSRDEQLPGRCEQIRIFPITLRQDGADGVSLAGRTGMDDVEVGSVLGQKLQRIRLVKGIPTIPRLGPDIYARNIESRHLISASGPTGSAKEIEQTWFHRPASLFAAQ
jgi:hypothetical protein